MTGAEKTLFMLRYSASLDVGVNGDDAICAAFDDVRAFRQLAGLDCWRVDVAAMLRSMLGAGECEATEYADPCPCCGGVHETHCIGTAWHLRCAACGHETGTGPSEDAAIMRWNEDKGPTCHGTGKAEVER